MAKPTGITGQIKLTVGGDGSGSAEFQQLPFPADKSESEKLIAQGFVAAIATLPASQGQALKITDLVQNGENDFDFSLNVEGVPSYLELVEAAPLKGPYEKAPGQYSVYVFAEQVLANIGGKASKYSGGNIGKPLYLLVYVTHWTFIFSDSVIQCLRYWLGSIPSPFTGVFLYKPVTLNEGLTCWLHPAEPRPGFHPNQVVNSMVTNFDPRSMRPQKGKDGSVFFSFPPVPPSGQ
jgi:hypothetical protein